MSKRWLAEALRWPEHRIRIVAPDIGGGFGAKMHFYAEEILVAYASKHFACPVSWTETRSENCVATTHGRAHVEYVEAAVTLDGKVLGMKVRSFANLGAYLSNMGTGIPTVNTAPAMGWPAGAEPVAPLGPRCPPSPPILENSPTSASRGR